MFSCPPPPCPPCHGGTPPNCVYLCTGCDSCKNNACVECGGVPGLACCDGIQCYAASYHECCGYGNGITCVKETECCMEGGCRPRDCGGECCRSDQFCCGNNEEGVCCDAEEVCCFYISPPYSHYCAQTCSSQVVDTDSCSETKEENEQCPACAHGIIPPFCIDFQWLDYSGLEIKQCDNGCPQRDWNVRDEVCYERKRCVGVFKENHMCVTCDGELICEPFLDSYELDCYYGLEGCIVRAACALLVNCQECMQANEVIDTHTRQTCDCVHE